MDNTGQERGLRVLAAPSLYEYPCNIHHLLPLQEIIFSQTATPVYSPPHKHFLQTNVDTPQLRRGGGDGEGMAGSLFLPLGSG